MNLTRLMSACGKAFIVSLVLTPIVRDVFRSYNVVDRPGIRKVHNYPIPRVGGVPIALAYLVGLISLRGNGSPFPTHWLQTILSGALVIFLTGLIDDFVSLRPVVKLLGQIVAAGVAFASGIRIDSVAGIDLPVWIALPLTIFWLLLTTNALNMIDGLDGLCAGIGFWGALASAAAAAATGNPMLVYTALPLAGALLGFLFFNFNPATVFLGDSGALLVGFLLGCFGIVWADHQLTPIAAAFPLFALCVPLLDLATSVVRRSLKRRPLFAADRGHMHHRLLDRRLTVRGAALKLYAAQITGAVFGLLLMWLSLRNNNGKNAFFMGLVGIAAVVAVIAGFRYLRYAEFEVAGQLLFRGAFYSLITQKLRMKKLAESLEGSRTEDEWWGFLAAAAREENWIRLEWSTAGGDVRDEILAERRSSWTFAVDLGGGESIQLRGDSRTAPGSSDLVGLSALLSRSLHERRRLWEQTALS
ncbi:MAG TPA: MraY family glycosyltransferase [Bryobacteraceae bacterium]|nr:MraY family glycosyltransferase [Bryobacteraceae bacterium]